jgi:DNA-binding MurR/RpiR family transcriptional regulator
MSIQTILQNQSARLTNSDKQLIDVLFAHPTESAFLSATELADRAGVHPSTVVRLAQKMGFAGYTEMREYMREEIILRSEPAERIRRSLARAESEELISNFIESEIAFLRDLPNHISQNQIDTIAKVLLSSRCVYIFAQGHATALAELFDRRLRRAGFDTIDLRSQGRDLAEHLLTIDQQDSLVAFAFHRQPQGLKLVMEQAKTKAARTILISDSLGMKIRPKPDHLLAAPRGVEGEFQTLSVPMAILNVLVLTLAKLDEGRSLQALDRLTQIVEELDHDPKENPLDELYP